LLAVKYGKEGWDRKECAEIIGAKQIQGRHAVLPKDVVRFITNLAEFFDNDLDADLFLAVVGVYHKLTRSKSIKFDDFRQLVRSYP
jgi:hypothetical protein